MERYKFKEGDTVHHVENLPQRMIVNRVIRQPKKIPTEDIDEETGKFVRVEKMFIIGIECYWWDEKKEYHIQKFHSRLLIPSHIVTMGDKSIKVFLDS